MISTDICVIGAGPAGLFSVFACGQLGMKCVVIDVLKGPGGQLTALYPEKPIYDIPSQPEIRADQLVAKLVEQAAPYEPQYLYDRVTNSIDERDDQQFILSTNKDEKISAKAIIVAAGSGVFGPNKPPLKDLSRYEETSIFYYIDDRERFRDKRVLISGGGDSAVDWALSLSEIAKQVYVVHRRNRFRAVPASVDKMQQKSNITTLTPAQVIALRGEEGVLMSLCIQDIEEGSKNWIDVDYFIPLFGLTTNLSAFDAWGLHVSGKVFAVDPKTCETSRSGIYAVGDVCNYPGKLKLILTGFAECSIAAHSAYERVYPGKALHFEYSTTRGVPGIKSSIKTSIA